MVNGINTSVPEFWNNTLASNEMVQNVQKKMDGRL